MEAVRKIYSHLPDILKTPQKMQRRRVEVILLPLDAVESPLSASEVQTVSLARFSGAWAGEPLIREDQGAYEIREKMK